MKKTYLVTATTAVCIIIAAFIIQVVLIGESVPRTIKVGFIYGGDASSVYTKNFLKVMEGMKHDNRIETLPKYNVPEGKEPEAFQELINEGCELIFSTSFGYGKTAKEFAKNYPNVQFCQSTCGNANEDPVVSNYHTFISEIYQGKYICGVVAGMKIKELIDAGKITAKQAKIGYVGAFPYAEVISGYTAFLLGVRSVVQEATMEVIYTNTWSSYTLERKAAERLIEDECVLISQHSDTKGAALACESASALKKVIYHVGYNQNMSDVAPTTTLTACRINWGKYMMAAAQAVLEERKIEKSVAGHVYGNSISAGFDYDWVEMLALNEVTAAKGTAEKVEDLIKQFKRGKIRVFKGNYIGVNPFDESDTYDLSIVYRENKNASSPSFHYVLKDVITIIDL